MKTSSTFPSRPPSLSVYECRGVLAGCPTSAVLRGGLVAWHSYIPERAEQPQTAGRGPADRLLCERFSLPSSQTISGDRLGGPLIRRSSPSLNSDLCSGCLSYIKVLLADLYWYHIVFLSERGGTLTGWETIDQRTVLNINHYMILVIRQHRVHDDVVYVSKSVWTTSSIHVFSPVEVCY